MAKLFYPAGTLPDKDDHVYTEAVGSGIVGPSCFLGGGAIDSYRPYAPKDVCSVCVVGNADREACGGRLRKEGALVPTETAQPALEPLDVESKVRHSTNQTAEAYRLRHERQGARLVALFNNVTNPSTEGKKP